MHGTYRIRFILTADALCNMQDTLGLRTSFCRMSYQTLTANGILNLLFRLLRTELGAQQQIVRRAFNQTQNSQQQVLRLNRLTLQTLRLIARVNNNPIQILCYYHMFSIVIRSIVNRQL